MFMRRVWPARASVWQPFPEFDQLRRDVFRLFDNVGEEPSSNVFPALNVTQDSESFYVRAELPGVSASDLKVTTEKNKLTIEGKRTLPREEKVSWHRREREEGTFSRSFTLPGPIASDRIEARYEDGVLTVVVPKAEDTKPRQIAVKTS